MLWSHALFVLTGWLTSLQLCLGNHAGLGLDIAGTGGEPHQDGPGVRRRVGKGNSTANQIVFGGHDLYAAPGPSKKTSSGPLKLLVSIVDDP